MPPAKSEPPNGIHQHDLWAWTVSFVITLGLHVGIVGFAALALASATYALASGVATTLSGVQAIAAAFTVLSLLQWAFLVKQLARGFRPRTWHGLGRLTIATTGSEWGEIAADLGTVLIGLSQVIPLIVTLSRDQVTPEAYQILLTAVGMLFIALGTSALVLRLWLRRRSSPPQTDSTGPDEQQYVDR